MKYQNQLIFFLFMKPLYLKKKINPKNFVSFYSRKKVWVLQNGIFSFCFHMNKNVWNYVKDNIQVKLISWTLSSETTKFPQHSVFPVVQRTCWVDYILTRRKKNYFRASSSLSPCLFLWQVHLLLNRKIEIKWKKKIALSHPAIWPPLRMLMKNLHLSSCRIISLLWGLCIVTASTLLQVFTASCFFRSVWIS